MTARSPVKLNTVFFKEWMTGTLSGTETDTLFQRMDGCSLSGSINRQSLKNWMSKVVFPK